MNDFFLEYFILVYYIKNAEEKTKKKRRRPLFVGEFAACQCAHTILKNKDIPHLVPVS